MLLLMLWQKLQFLPLFLTPKLELLQKKEPLHNILLKLGACLMHLPFDPKFLPFPEFV